MNAHAPDLFFEEFDPRALRDAFGQFATGVTVITTIGDEGAPVGMVANSFSSVSMDPPLILWSIGLKTPSLGAFRSHPSFAINIMCQDSKDLVHNFSRPSDTKFADVGWTKGIDGVPILDRAATVLECRTENRYEGGDHEIYLGRVCRFSITDKEPLIFHKGKFAEIGSAL